MSVPPLPPNEGVVEVWMPALAPLDDDEDDLYMTPPPETVHNENANNSEDEDDLYMTPPPENLNGVDSRFPVPLDLDIDINPALIPLILGHEHEQERVKYCWTTFHLKCVRLWAAKSVKDIKEAWCRRSESGRKDD
ncbi:hypothetical protein HETIRDRAFT_103921 [Heterobasidion irregulare TC 32-1]|uniref:Uncharacterized protein n=1 Tax=Heterobasidion irregulare (strain TC 32-1) TaxID=747525 RepID=W4JYI2_HETIT|nr:uncharacterized protein HETIRDRAFT_103921 [Heterobasidion irregulare TC 32-1]ETW78509.1 hypothetical protein HETIRDRAFT_103921 [Heterobasidion irregulare TC 32-1]